MMISISTRAQMALDQSSTIRFYSIVNVRRKDFGTVRGRILIGHICARGCQSECVELRSREYVHRVAKKFVIVFVGLYFICIGRYRNIPRESNAKV